MNKIDRPPKIILIVVDCLRADHLGCYGYKRDTSPNIDMFAGESVFFKWAFSVISYTCPSFASILTSLYPSRHSLGFQQKFPRLDQDRDLLVSEVLKSLHYSTAFFAGAIPLREGVGLNSGFDTYDCRIPDGRRSAEMTNNRFYEWLNSKYRDNLFALIHYYDVHLPYLPPYPFNKMFVNDQYVKPQIPLDVIPDGWGSDAEIPETGGIPRSALLKRDDQLVREPEYYIAQYDGCIKYVDNAFAELVARLNKLGIYDDCLLMITSDHGEAMGENNVWFYHGLTVTPDQIHVPLMIKPHQGWNIRPKTIETPVSHVDLFPTISELVGFDCSGIEGDGRSLVKLMEKGTDRALESRTILSEIEGQQALITNKSIQVKKKSIDKNRITHFYVEALCQQEMSFDYRKEKQIPDWNGMEDAERHYIRLHQYRFAGEFVKGKKVLDIACGEGDGTHMLSEEADSVVGTNFDEDLVKYAVSNYSRKNIRFIQSSVTPIPIEGEKIFDAVVCFEVLEHIEDQDAFMNEIKRVLKADGVFIVSMTGRSARPGPLGLQKGMQSINLDFDSFKDLLTRTFQHLYLYSQNIYPCSNIFLIHNGAGAINEYNIEKRDQAFCFSSPERRSAKIFIAIASDRRFNSDSVVGNSYLLDLSETLFKQKDERIFRMEGLLRKNRNALNDQLFGLKWMMNHIHERLDHIYESHGWKMLLIFYRSRDKLFPLNTKRRLIAKVVLRTLTDPEKMFRGLNRTNLKKFIHYFWITEPTILESKVERNISRLSTKDNGMDIPETVNELTDEDFKSVGSAIGTGGNHLEKAAMEEEGPPERNALRVIAFYLPQFHPIPENDRWWGKGFTDWTNVVKAKPNFIGHYQPHFPAELGFYDLRVPEVRQMQVNLAREHGIYGFCYHHYWFHGRRLLERPFNEVLNTGKPDFPFCLCWANENWTRRWDGAEQEILIAQSHSREDDIAFIRDVIPAFRDERYIRIDGKPLLIVYRVNLLPKPKETAEIWRKECSALGIGDIFLCAAQTFDIADPRPYGFDAAVEFPPHGLFIMEMSERVQVINPDFKGLIHNYAEVLRFMKLKKRPRYTLFRTVIPSWDNTARRQNAGNIFVNTTLDLYQGWLTHSARYTIKNLTGDERIIFINAWNEWAEGCHLEPDKRFGDQYLKATKTVLQRFNNLE